jgi:adenosylcobinamide kinase/adenosylcobinamide-phosphate guanylyltransferase
MGRLTLILGGARSGKSTFAQHLAIENGGQVVFIATAQAGDPEMAARIAAHKAARPNDWMTLECPTGLADTWEARAISSDLVIVDCLTFLVTNLLLGAAPDVDQPDEDLATTLVTGEIEALLKVIQEYHCDWIIVSNEVGLGLVPPYPLGRLFRDLLGWANQSLASKADQVFYLVAGIPIPIHDFRQP